LGCHEMMAVERVLGLRVASLYSTASAMAGTDDGQGRRGYVEADQGGRGSGRGLKVLCLVLVISDNA
jgi:hypothetical protein